MDGTTNIAVISLGVPENHAEAPPPYAQVQEESEKVDWFSDPSIRRGFLRKVFLTVMIQLLITFAVICPFLYWNQLRTWVVETSWFTYSMMAVLPVVIIVSVFCTEIQRKVPWNFISLGIFSLIEGLMLGSLCVFFNAEPVLWATGATALLCSTLALFTLQSRLDLKWWIGVLWVTGWSLLSFGILFVFPFQSLHIVLACLGTILFSVYIVVDILWMLNGDLDPEEYIFAALKLYMDILLLFLYLLQHFGFSSK